MGFPSLKKVSQIGSFLQNRSKIKEKYREITAPIFERRLQVSAKAREIMETHLRKRERLSRIRRNYKLRYGGRFGLS